MMRRRLARLPLKRSIAIAIILCVVVVSRRAASAGDDRARFDHRVATVRDSIDGNTLAVDVEGTAIRVRLLGIDATPSAAPYVIARAAGARVTLRLDELAATRSAAGDLLAYVYLDDAELLNQSMIRDGVAYADRIGDCDLSAALATEENGARAAHRGFWKTITVDQMPAWRQRWMREHHLN